jgi:DNA-binding CsgD family transcriptional regulator
MRPRKIDPERIPALVAQGLRTAQIANEFGCTEGTLRVRCSQLKISLRLLCKARSHAEGNVASSRSSRVAPIGKIHDVARATGSAGQKPARSRKIDPELIPPMVARGLSPGEIAGEFGCTVGTLRVKCSRLNISLRRPKDTSKTRSPSDASADGRPVFTGSRRSTVNRTALTDKMAIPGNTTQFDLALPRVIIDQLQQRAAVMGISAATLAASLLETISRDCLYTAVLDTD